jgi:hypothetical protein
MTVFANKQCHKQISKWRRIKFDNVTSILKTVCYGTALKVADTVM